MKNSRYFDEACFHHVTVDHELTVEHFYFYLEVNDWDWKAILTTEYKDYIVIADCLRNAR